MVSGDDFRQAVKAAVRVVPDFPFPGCNFRDIAPVWEQEPRLFRFLVEEIARPYRESQPDVAFRRLSRLSLRCSGRIFATVSIGVGAPFG